MLTEDEQIFASIDLRPLSYPELPFSNHKQTLYSEYRSKIYKEYQEHYEKQGEPINTFHTAWINGRMEFIESMLEREYIYPWKPFRDKFEETAQVNLKEELICLQDVSILN